MNLKVHFHRSLFKNRGQNFAVLILFINEHLLNKSLCSTVLSFEVLFWYIYHIVDIISSILYDILLVLLKLSFYVLDGSVSNENFSRDSG